MAERVCTRSSAAAAAAPSSVSSCMSPGADELEDSGSWGVWLGWGLSLRSGPGLRRGGVRQAVVPCWLDAGLTDTWSTWLTLPGPT
eukprot:COSAG01_NODE_12483_length_1731_cov_2.113358_3_plen_86_part_00